VAPAGIAVPAGAEREEALGDVIVDGLVAHGAFDGSCMLRNTFRFLIALA
jgi:hypothetical protein